MALALLSTSWLLLTDQVVAVKRPSKHQNEKKSIIRGVSNQSDNEQQHRRLFGERIGTSRDARGGAAGAAKNFQEFVPMRDQIVPATPTVVPAPTTDAPITAPVDAATEPPTAPPVDASTDAPTGPPVATSGCSFDGPDGTAINFDEGASLDGFITLTDCFNGDPDLYPCFCDSREPDQTICPYCQFTDAFGRTICGSDTGTVTFIEQDSGEQTTCSCDIAVVENPPFFDRTVESSCVLGGIEVPVVTTNPTAEPTNSPTVPAIVVTESPTTASVATTGSPTEATATEAPTQAPVTGSPVEVAETAAPTQATVSTTDAPTTSPTTPATDPDPGQQGSTFVMGRLSKVENGLTLSEGLSSVIIARTFDQVLYPGTGELSVAQFHPRPSGGDTFADTRGDNDGGWVYLSSRDASAEGGIGQFTMNAAGDVINYEMILEGTLAISNGGRTPWDTWVAGEHDLTDLDGGVHQVDPFGVRETELLTLTQEGGAWEGFAYDMRNANEPRFFQSEGYTFGAIRRYTPAAVNREDPWTMLTEGGLTEYLELTPNAAVNKTSGTFRWSNEIMLARANAARNYPETQGLDVNGSTLSFVCQGVRTLFQLNLDDGTYTASSTNSGLMDGEPNEVRYVEGSSGTLLYMTETNGRRGGVHARNEAGEFYTVLEGSYQPETAGFALSPNGKHMYVSFKRDGLVFDITRDDGLSFFDTIQFESSVAVSRDIVLTPSNRQ